MASADQLKALIKSHLSRDEGQFYAIAMQVAACEAKNGHGNLAIEIRNMIDAAKAKAVPAEIGKLVPLARARGELAHVLTVTHPKNRLRDMILDEKALAQLQQIIKEQRMFARIREHGLAPRRKVLLVGPPGTGKTMTASVLAGELGVPLFIVRLDSLITKFMGETAAKLRQIFDSTNDMRGVYFFDEFDAIGSQRGLGNDVGEIRRVLNSFLQMIEQDQSNSLILAATNHPEILDYALFRRFDDVVEFQLPTRDQIVGLLHSRLGSFLPKRFPSKAISQTAEGLSCAEVSRAIDGAIKDSIMHDDNSVNPAVLSSMLEERRHISARLSGKHKDHGLK